MQITVLNVTQSTQPSKTPGKTFQQLEVAYKNNTFGNKVEAKKLMPFGAQKQAFDLLATAQSGQSFEVEVVKNAAGFNDWVSVQPSNGAAPVQGVSGVANKPAPAAPPRGNFETPEERARRQVYIVRQSSASSAIALHSVGAKTAPNVDDVLKTAKRLEDYVFGRGDTGFEDVPDFPAELAQPEID